MTHRCMLAACLSLSLLFLVAPTHADVAPLPGGPKISDCSKARDPARCEAHIRARQACGDKRGDAKRLCMDTYAMSPDCARADNPKKCIVQKNAEQACRGKQGKEHKTCMQAELKKKPKSSKLAQPVSKPEPGQATASTS